MASKALKASVLAVVVALGAYWYWSPFLAIHQLRAAAKAGDADAFNERVDYPRLRESLKGQLSAAIGDRMGDGEPTNGAARAGAVLGSLFATALSDRMVDAFVRPEVVMRVMQEGKLLPKSDHRRGRRDQENPPEEASGSESSRSRTPVWSTERTSVDKLILYARDAGQPEEKRTGLVFERRGFASWQLTEIRLPAL